MIKRVKVLHLLSSNTFSGAENMVGQIIKMFKNTGFDMVYCSPDGPIKKELSQIDIDFFPLSKLKYSELKNVVDEFKPEFIHAHDVKASLIASFFSKEVKIISHIHGNHENMRCLSLKSILFRYSLKRFKKVIWVSNSALKQYRYYNSVKQKSIVLSNIIDISSVFEKMSIDKNEYNFDIIYLGRLTYAKDPMRLLEILRDVTQELPHLKIAIVGDGDLYTSVLKYVKKEGLDSNITLLGYIINPYKMLSSSRVMIMTSRYEGTPMCALEAMCLGTPIVTTPTDGLVDLITNGENGFLCSTDEDVKNKIINIIKNDKLYSELSNNCKRFSGSINDIEKYRESLINIYLVN
jgi:glycosyltransferase involved in cell wall biosynthesis